MQGRGLVLGWKGRGRREFEAQGRGLVLGWKGEGMEKAEGLDAGKGRD